MTGQLLEDLTNGTASPKAEAQAGSRDAVRWGTHRKWVAAARAAVVVAAALAIWAILQMPMDVPDAASPPLSSYLGKVDAWNSVGQTFVARRDNLNQILLVLATKRSNDYSSITLTVRDGGPEGPVLRAVKMPISKLLVGDPGYYRPGGLHEKWQAFDFEPIPNSGGRTLFFSVEGKYLPPQNGVRVLMMFYSKYPQGKGYVNGGVQNANVLFRTRSEARVSDYLGVLAENVTAQKQGLLASPATYVALGVVYLFLLVVLIKAVGGALRS